MSRMDIQSRKKIMMYARSFEKGYEIDSIDGKTWQYSDTDEDVDHNNLRPCKKCGKKIERGDFDSCLGALPGVAHACCGHGIRSEAYIQFTNGVTIRGFILEENIDNV